MTKKKLAVTLVAFLLVAVGGGTFFIIHTRAPVAIPRPTTSVTTKSLDQPSEAPIATSSYVSTATGNEPKYITLPSIKAEGYIEQMGIDQYGAVAAPNNIHIAGWYVNSFKPGEYGLSIVDGHVDGQKATGIFFRLAQLKQGDTFDVELANGVAHQFQVKSITTVPDADSQTALFTRDNSIKSQLNLITCGGKFDRQSRSYLGRTVVVSALVS